MAQRNGVIIQAMIDANVPLTYPLSSPDTYRISCDGVEVGSVSKQVQHTTSRGTTAQPMRRSVLRQALALHSELRRLRKALRK